MKRNKLIVVSADAMVDADLELMETLPNYQAIFGGRASMVKRVRTIYPTVTYPAHASMRTGVYPTRHGIISNEVITVGQENLPWVFFNDALRVPDIFDAAKKAGLSTASVFWPSTGCHPPVDYLIDEYWPQSETETLEEAMRRAGSSEDIVENVIRPNHHGERMRYHPESEEMGTRFVCEIIRRYQPDLLLYHPANIDAMRHHYGLFNDQVTQSLLDTDRWLGDILQAVKDAGELENTNFILMSDHGQLNIQRVINPNVILADHGLIQLDEAGKPVSWQAFAVSVGMSAYVYLSDPEDQALFDRVQALLRFMAEEGIYGISEVFTRQEIEEKEGLSGGFSFVIETDGYTTFGGRATRPIVNSFDVSDYRYGRATHGYLPDKGPQPVFIAAGPDVRPGVMLERRPIVDAPATMARLIGVELPGADGKPFDEMLY